MGSRSRGADSLVERQKIRMAAGFARLIIISALILPICENASAQQELVHPAGIMKIAYNTPDLFVARVSGGTNQFVYRPSGRIRFGTGDLVPTGGNPLVSGDEGRWIAGEMIGGQSWDLTDFTNKLTLSVNGERMDPYIMQYEQTPTADIGELPVFWPGGMFVGTRDLMGTQLVPVMSDVPTEGEPNLRIRHRWEMIHDGLMIEKIVYNDDSTTHNIGLRLLLDTTFGTDMFDGRPIILDDGTQITTETLIPDPRRPDLSMPTTWVAYDDPNVPRVALRGTLDAEEVHRSGIASQSAGRPDHIGFGQYRTMGLTGQWDWNPDAQTPLVGERWAYMVRWDERPLQPGQSRRYVTFFGLGAASVDYDPTFGFGLYSPSRLEVREGDDPLTPEIEEYYLAEPDGSSVFTVSAAIDHFGDAPITSASVRINLPIGLELFPDTQSRTIALGLIQRNQSPLPIAQWTVRAVDARPGRAPIQVTGPLGKVLTRQISIPAIPVLPPSESQLGLEMLSIPYSFTNSDAAHVFGSLTDSLYPGGPVTLWRWHPRQQRYITYPNIFVSNITPGMGMWLLNENRETIVLPDDAASEPIGQSFTLPLSAGWNQIGNPHVVPARFDQMTVIGPQGAELSIEQAALQGLILPVLYSYDAAANEYAWESSLPDTSVVPYQGYWLLAFRDISVVFPPPTLFAPASTGSVAAADEGWKVGLVVERGDRGCAPRYLAVASGASDQIDIRDVPAPPEAMSTGPKLDAYFTIADDDRGMRYLMDTRSAANSRQEWDFTVVSEAPGARVTVRWPDLSSAMPEDLVATLEDVATGRRVYMRTSESYSYVPSATGARQFKISVRPRAQATLGLSATARSTAGGPGLDIVYSLSSDAVVDVEIRNIAGRVVKHLAAQTPAGDGQNTLMWNGLSDAGTAVPSGIYIVQVTARSPETGEQMSVIRTANLQR